VIIIGINAYHGDSSACLLMNGKLIAAVEEERFKRIKHWAGFPIESIRYCLEEAGINICDVDHVAINTDPKANFIRKFGYTLYNSPDLKFILDRIKNKKERASVERELEKAFPGESINAKIHYIEHHLSHLASTHFVSPFEESVTISIDGFGDFSSAALGTGLNGKIKVDKRVFFPHSLGIFYQALTQFIGFPHYGDEYKVMGLAPYGKPKFIEQMRDIVLLKSNGLFELNLKYFRHHAEGVEYEWQGGSPVIGELFNKNEMEILFDVTKRDKAAPLENVHYDLAHSVQAMYEEAFFNVLNTAYKKYGVDNLTLAGGCAMNSVANGKVRRCSPFKSVYIQSAAGDAGGAIGAAFVVASQLGENKEKFCMDHAYWGPSFSNGYCKQLLEKESNALKSARCSYEYIDEENDLCTKTAEGIANGLVIGWFQGRMEWGPRALGNRSILGDPRRADMKDILNLKIKRRESFRPFAPSILREEVLNWFEEENDVPFMMQVFQIRENKRSEIPAVTHVDGSGRLQTVCKDTNPRYYSLISKFNRITGVPIVLNTSFNENEPVVCKPDEALNTFLRTKLDVLVLGNWFVSRNTIDS